MKVEKTSIEGLLIIHLDRFEDDRGCFFETYHKEVFNKAVSEEVRNLDDFMNSKADTDFVQDNYSISHKGVVRGLHFQTGAHAQGKLVQVLNGVVLDVVVDLRDGSPTFGQHESVTLSGGDNKQLWVPAGFAHGFKSLVDNTHFHYKCTNYYNKESEGGLLYNDIDLGINWGGGEVIVSEKDLLLPKFRDIYPLDDKE